MERGEVQITDINIPFMSMVILMVKWTIASIPAMIILMVMGVIFTVVFGGVLGGLMWGDSKKINQFATLAVLIVSIKQEAL